MGAGYAAIAVAAVLWAAGGTVARHLIGRGADFVELTEARAWLSALGLGALVLWRGRSVRRPRTGAGRSLHLVLLVFGLSIAGANFLYYASLSRLPVAVAITVQYTAPGLVVLWGLIGERRRPGRRLVGALLLALLGVTLLAELPEAAGSGDGPLDLLGLAAAAGSAVAFASYMVTGERVGRALGAEDALFRGFLVASAFWIVVQAVRGRAETLLDPSLALWIVGLAVFTTIFPFLLFVWGLERVDAARAGIVSTLEPLAAAVLAWVWLGESLAPVQVLGAAMVVAGIGVVQAERPQSPEALAERSLLE